jgi:flagellar basal body-associated protein FliL
MNIAVHIDETAAPANTDGVTPAPKKHGAALTIVVVLFALAALGGAGYLLYKNLTSPVTG